MAYTSEQARAQVLDELAAAIDRLAVALAALGEAYETVDEDTAARLERELFQPVQGAHGRACRAHAEFAAAHGISRRGFRPGSPGPHATDPRVYLERAIEASGQADRLLAELQDSMLPVEVGDRRLRDGLTVTRGLISRVPARGRQLARAIGR
jgi:hypothetical protein